MIPISQVGRYVAFDGNVGKVVRNDYGKISVKLPTGKVVIIDAKEVRPAPSIYQQIPQYDRADVHRAVEDISMEALRRERSVSSPTAIARQLGVALKKVQVMLSSGIIPSDILPLIADSGIADISVDSVEWWLEQNEVPTRA